MGDCGVPVPISTGIRSTYSTLPPSISTEGIVRNSTADDDAPHHPFNIPSFAQSTPAMKPPNLVDAVRSLPSRPPPRRWPRVVLRTGFARHCALHGPRGCRETSRIGGGKHCCTRLHGPGAETWSSSGSPRTFLGTANNQIGEGFLAEGSLRGPRGQCSCGDVLVHTSRM